MLMTPPVHEDCENGAPVDIAISLMSLNPATALAAKGRASHAPGARSASRCSSGGGSHRFVRVDDQLFSSAVGVIARHRSAKLVVVAPCQKEPICLYLHPPPSLSWVVCELSSAATFAGFREAIFLQRRWIRRHVLVPKDWTPNLSM